MWSQRWVSRWLSHEVMPSWKRVSHWTTTVTNAYFLFSASKVRSACFGWTSFTVAAVLMYVHIRFCCCDNMRWKHSHFCQSRRIHDEPVCTKHTMIQPLTEAVALNSWTIQMKGSRRGCFCDPGNSVDRVLSKVWGEYVEWLKRERLFTSPEPLSAVSNMAEVTVSWYLASEV